MMLILRVDSRVDRKHREAAVAKLAQTYLWWGASDALGSFGRDKPSEFT